MEGIVNLLRCPLEMSRNAEIDPVNQVRFPGRSPGRIEVQAERSGVVMLLAFTEGQGADDGTVREHDVCQSSTLHAAQRSRL